MEPEDPVPPFVILGLDPRIQKRTEKMFLFLAGFPNQVGK
jgi:hypothetical protein